jgi:glutaredoxin
MKTKFFIFVVVVVLVVGGFGIYMSKVSAGPSNLEPFATCLKNSGAKFYGAFWCPHCQDQKKLFGTAKESLPYIECSNPDAKSQTQICKDNGIESYPTWIFADGTKLSGSQTLQTLADKTQCQLPK